MNLPGAIAGAVAFLACVILVPIVKVFSARYKLFDPPGPLKNHSRQISRLGGIAIGLSIALGILLGGRFDLAAHASFLTALLLVWITGLTDDIWGLSPVSRLAAQIAAGSMLWFGGLRIPHLGDGVGEFVGICLVVVIFTNAFNFCDGSDGVAAGVAAIIGGAYILQSDGSQGSLSMAVAWALVGTCLGFLFFNFPPASVFMGDSGSTVLGVVCAYLALNLYRAQERAPLAFAIAFLPAALPLIDAACSPFFAACASKTSLIKGDRFHLYDLLIAREWPSRRVALACYGITGIFCLAGWITTKCTFSWGIAVSTLTVGSFLILEWRLGALQTAKPKNSMLQGTGWRPPNLLGNTK